MDSGHSNIERYARELAACFGGRECWDALSRAEKDRWLAEARGDIREREEAREVYFG